MRHYTVQRGSIDTKSDTHYIDLKNKYDKLIKDDQFMDLTLTYDFERSKVRRVAVSNG
jgi:hypothetical protein